jgi:hypothetical protein
MNNNRVFSNNNNNKPWTEEELAKKINKVDTSLFVAELIKALREAGIDFTDVKMEFECKRAFDGEVFLAFNALFIKPEEKPEFNFRINLNL